LAWGEYGAWQFDVGGDTGYAWPDGTPFTVTITMDGWYGSKNGVVYGHTNVGNIILYSTSGPLNSDAGGVYYGYVDEEVDFYGTASGGALPYSSWYWNFGDGNWSNGQYSTHVYSEPGNYIVTFTVTDAASQTATDTTNAEIISGTTPTAYANGPYQGMTGEEIQFNGDVIGGTSPYIWLWDFGDGETSNDKYIVHIYDEIDDYTVSLTVTDDLGYTDTDNTSCLVTIYNNPPLKPNTPEGEDTGEVGEEYTFYTVTSDPEDDQVWYKWDWGDELSDWVGPYNSVEIVSMSNTWDEQGDYEIKVKAKDIHGDESPWSDPLSISMPKKLSVNNNGLIGYWSFDESTFGTAPDESGNGNDGLIYGATNIDGISDDALYFDGVDDYVDVGNDDSLKNELPASISCWLKINDFNSNEDYVIYENDKWEYPNGYYGYRMKIHLPDRLIKIAYGDGGHGGPEDRRGRLSSTPLDANTWYHVVGIINGSTDMDIYINGEEDNGDYGIGYGDSLAYSDSSGFISQNGFFNLFFNGALDELRVYDRSLVDNEILDLFQDSFKNYLIIGPISNLDANTNNYISFKAENLGIFDLSKFQFIRYSSGEKIMILENYFGILNVNYAIGFFKAII